VACVSVSRCSLWSVLYITLHHITRHYIVPNPCRRRDESTTSTAILPYYSYNTLILYFFHTPTPRRRRGCRSPGSSRCESRRSPASRASRFTNYSCNIRYDTIRYDTIRYKLNYSAGLSRCESRRSPALRASRCTTLYPNLVVFYMRWVGYVIDSNIGTDHSEHRAKSHRAAQT
jgi:hypothetical protein